MMKKRMNLICGLIGVSVVLFALISGAVSGTIRYDENFADGEISHNQSVIIGSTSGEDPNPSVAATAAGNSSWDIETVDSGGNVGQFASLALDSNNYPHISYYDATNGTLKYAWWTGSSWNIETVDDRGDVGRYSSLALDSSDRPYISYYNATTGDLEIVWWTGKVWLLQTVASAGNVGAFTSLALDPSNRPHISYYDVTNGNLKYARWNGSAWSIETVDLGGDVGRFTSLALDAKYNPHISYYDVTNGNLKYAWWTGSAWSIESVASSKENTGAYTSLALNSSDYPQVSYYDVTNGDLKYARWTGSVWSIETVDAGGDVGGFTSLALDSNDYPHISYYDATSGALKYAAWTGGKWRIETVDDGGDVGGFTSLALDSSAYPHISYYDFDTDDLKYVTVKPDLIITDFWLENGTICYQLHNIGGTVAPHGHFTGLYLSDPATSLPSMAQQIDVDLAPGERLKRCFPTPWQCSGSADTLYVCADCSGDVVEKNESNNCREETWKCDVTPPAITSGPTVSALTPTSVSISWNTDEASDSVVKFGRYAGVYEDKVSSTKLTQTHVVALSALEPSTTYHYVVQSSDASGNTVVSRKVLFETQPVPDNEPPVLISLNITKVAGDIDYYEIDASAYDNIGIERVEFYLDDMRIGIDYTAPYRIGMGPGIMNISREEFFSHHNVRAVAYDIFGRHHDLSQYWEDWECENIALEINRPYPGMEIYTDQDVVLDGTFVDIEVFAAVVQRYLEVPSGDWYAHGHGGPHETIYSNVSRVEFYVDGDLKHTAYPDESLDYTYLYEWDAGGYSFGPHEIGIIAIASEDCKKLVTCEVEVVRGEPRLEVTREVSRQDNVFLVDLTVRNRGTTPSAPIDKIKDSVVGFQPIRRLESQYAVTTNCYPRGGYGPDIEIDLFLSDPNATDADAIRLDPGRGITIEYEAVPVLWEASRTYSIGWKDVEIVYAQGTHDSEYFATPCTLLSDGRTRLADAVVAAMHASDYLIVTVPRRLFDNYRDEEVEELLSAMASLAANKTGVLGYMDISDRDYFRSLIDSDGPWSQMIPNWTSTGYLLIVGENEIVQSWTVNTPDIPWTGGNFTTCVTDSDLPYADILGNDNVPELIVGRIIGNDASDLIRPIAASIAVAGGTGFDRSFGIVTSGREEDWEDFVPQANDLEALLDDQMADGATTLHWSKWVHKDETMDEGYRLPLTSNDGFLLADVDGDGACEAIVVDGSTDLASVYEYSNLSELGSTASDSFTCRFAPYDGLAAGDIDGDGVDEIIVGTDEGDTIAIFNDFPRHTEDNEQFPEFSVDFDAWDVIASGDLWGDGDDEIILASTDDYGTIYIYSYIVPAGGNPYPELRLRDTLEFVSFTSYDGFALGNVAGDAKDEIIVANDVTDRIYIYNAVGSKIGELEADPFTKYDGLAVGDVDGDGMDEIAIIIDDEIDGKRRLFVYEDDSWYYDAAEGEWKIRRGGVHKIYSRFFDFHGIRYTASDTRHDGFAIGDINGDGEAEIGVALEGSDRFYLLDGHYPDGWKGRYMPWIISDESAIDIFTLIGHGNPTSCSPFETRDIASVNFSAHPVVFALSCLTGNYEGHWWEWTEGRPDVRTDHWDGDDGFAEAFFDSGAGVYIGSTQVSFDNEDTLAGPGFFNEWGTDETAGEAFTHYKRNRAATGDDLWQFWVTEYNYYGDPKFGALGGDRSASVAHVTKEENELPPSTLNISIHGYVVNTTAGDDYVTIPGGEVLLEDGKPRVPYYMVKTDFPAGYMIQDVKLIEKSDLSTVYGLNIPLTVMWLDSLESSLTADSIPDGEEWYPTEDFNWRVIPNGDGSSTLVLNVYPFYYNQLTTGVRFYQHYSFEITYTASTVQIAALTTDKAVYSEGEDVLVNLWLNNLGTAQDVLVDAVVKAGSSGEVVSGLLLRTLKACEGLASFSSRWDSSGVEPGYYFVDVTLKDTSGNVLDRRTEMFRLGISSGTITHFTATPEYFEIGDEIAIDLTFENTGTVNLTGTAVIMVRNATGSEVMDFRHNVTDLIPLGSVSFSDTWNTAAAAEGSYELIGYVLYESTATDPISIIVRTAPDAFDTGASAQPYPSLAGTHSGTIMPLCNITVSNLYTYSCAGTGGHAESIELFENGTLLASGAWEGYGGDWQNITIYPTITLQTGHVYNYTIRTGSYPQIIHEPSWNATGGTITCTSFVDINGQRHEGWIPAITLWSD
jgi:hypothetical protein